MESPDLVWSPSTLQSPLGKGWGQFLWDQCQLCTGPIRSWVPTRLHRVLDFGHLSSTSNCPLICQPDPANFCPLSKAQVAPSPCLTHSGWWKPEILPEALSLHCLPWSLSHYFTIMMEAAKWSLFSWPAVAHNPRVGIGKPLSVESTLTFECFKINLWLRW